MRMIEADKVIPLVRLLLLFHPNAERIVEDMQAVVDSHTIEAEPVRHGRWVISSDGYYPYCWDCKERPKGGNMTKYCPNCGKAFGERNNTV